MTLGDKFRNCWRYPGRDDCSSHVDREISADAAVAGAGRINGMDDDEVDWKWKARGEGLGEREGEEWGE